MKTMWQSRSSPVYPAPRARSSPMQSLMGSLAGLRHTHRAVRDPSHPTRMPPAYDSGDHLHPNDLGMQAMANAILLGLFRGSAATVPAGQRKRK